MTDSLSEIQNQLTLLQLVKHIPSIENNGNLMEFHNYTTSSEFNENFKKIITASEKINDKIKKAFPNSKISVVGGSIRDTLLGKPVKDLDLLITMDADYFFNKVENITTKNTIFDFFNFIKKTLKNKINPQQQYLTITKKEDDPSRYTEKFKQACEEIIGKATKKIKNDFSSSQISEFITYNKELPNEDSSSDLSKEISKKLIGVIKIEDPTFMFNVDLLISTLPPSEYIRYFDYNLCKTYYVHNEKQTHYENIIVSKDFITDISQKKLTLNTKSLMEESEILKSYEKRYKKLNKKYPEYQFDIMINKTDDHVFNLDNGAVTIDKEKRNAIINYITLSEMNSQQNQPIKKVKI
jgi:protein-tyrosine-phosphatase